MCKVFVIAYGGEKGEKGKEKSFKAQRYLEALRQVTQLRSFYANGWPQLPRWATSPSGLRFFFPLPRPRTG